MPQKHVPIETHGDTAAKAVLKASVPVQTYGGRMAKSLWVSTQLLLYYGRLLKWLKDRGMLPERSVHAHVRSPPRLRSHFWCASPCGQQRCIRCLRIGGEGGDAACLAVGARPHRLMVLGAGIFCSSCGGYSFSRTLKLRTGCKGMPSSTVVRGRLARMWAGCHPISGAALGVPRPLGDPATEFSVHLGPIPDELLEQL